MPQGYGCLAEVSYFNQSRKTKILPRIADCVCSHDHTESVKLSTLRIVKTRGIVTIRPNQKDPETRMFPVDFITIG